MTIIINSGGDFGRFYFEIGQEVPWMTTHRQLAKMTPIGQSLYVRRVLRRPAPTGTGRGLIRCRCSSSASQAWCPTGGPAENPVCEISGAVSSVSLLAAWEELTPGTTTLLNTEAVKTRSSARGWHHREVASMQTSEEHQCTPGRRQSHFNLFRVIPAESCN